MSLPRSLLRTAAALLALGLAGSALWAMARARLPREIRLDRARRAGVDLLKALGWRRPPARCEIRIYKADRRLELLGDGKIMLRCPCALGGAPTGDKIREGDLKTPEGSFYVCTRNDRSKFHLFLGLSYPGEDDAARGLKDGLVTPPQAEAIRSAQRRRTRPPWHTPLGGMIGIHGYGTAWDWTLGCVALADGDIERLWAFCPLGTDVKIFP